MENNVLSNARGDQSPRTGGGAVDQAIDRSLEGRREAARQEIERLISAAFRVIERTGHLEPKVSEILAEAGLSNQAFYRHFAGKHALLVALLDEGIRGLADYLAARMAEAPDPIARPVPFQISVKRGVGRCIPRSGTHPRPSLKNSARLEMQIFWQVIDGCTNLLMDRMALLVGRMTE